MAMATLETRPHVLVFPYRLQGHVIPTVHLAINLASRGFTVTFINTHSIHHHTSATARKNGLDIRYTTVSDGLPVEHDRSLNHDQSMESVLHVMSSHVEELVAKQPKLVRQSVPPVTCLIADTFFVWPSVVAKKFSLYVSFWTEPALVFSICHHMDLLKKNGHSACQDNRKDLIDYILGVKSIHPNDLPSYLQQTNTSTVFHRIISKVFNDVRGAHSVLWNTVQELEPHTISALQALLEIMSGYVIRNESHLGLWELRGGVNSHNEGSRENPAISPTYEINMD